MSVDVDSNLVNMTAAVDIITITITSVNGDN